MTIEEVRAAITKQLSEFFDEPSVIPSVLASNSKFYYIVLEDSESADRVIRFPLVGNETVLDAIAQIGGLPQDSNKHVWIARPSDDAVTPHEILPVDLIAIAREGTGTNYQLLPGDRVFVSHRRPEDHGNRTAAVPASNVVSTASQPPRSAETRAQTRGSGIERVSFKGPRGTVIARVPTIACPSHLQENAQIRIRIEVITDPNKNLSEYWRDSDGGALLVDTDQISASLRILEKNGIIKKLMAPAITCLAGQDAVLETDGLCVKGRPMVTEDERVLLMTEINRGSYTKIVEVNAVLREGETVLVPVSRDDGEYVVLTTELLKLTE
jgi:protein involved in polysaccharide export with SLBB domain